jgi:hypothetical protein
MNIVALQKLLPATVEELAVAAEENSLEAEFLRFKLGDPDAHALARGLEGSPEEIARRIAGILPEKELI